MKTIESDDCCPMCGFDYRVCNAIVEVAKKYDLVVKGSVIPTSKDVYRIRFTAGPEREERQHTTFHGPRSDDSLSSPTPP